MAEIVSPIRTPGQYKQRAPVLSPDRPLFLGSNDDKLERAQARAARAAAIRRKPVTQPTDASPTDPCLGQEQIMELFQNCIKLASENKINQKNTWELNLIDHLCDIIKVEEENDVETNFQKASCTLEAGVRIYSMRVDSVHSEAYKVLGGISRVSQDTEHDSVEEGNADNVQAEGTSKKEKERKLSPLTTLESSFEAINVKKFDVAFAVDPLYHQTTAQFDEGGSKGLLLYNLGVYGGCRMVFDSSEVPGKCMTCSSDRDKIETIDISYATDCVEQMVSNFSKKLEITPTLKQIVDMFDEDNKRPTDTFSSQRSVEPDHEANGDDYIDDGHDNSETWDFVNENQTSLNDEGTYEGEEEYFVPVHHEDNGTYVYHDVDVDDKSLTVDSFLFLSLGQIGKQNAWAGPDHWKYRKTKGPEDLEKENGSPVMPKKQRNKKQAEPDIDFMKALELDSDVSNIFAPPKNPNTLLLPAKSRELCNTTLPEDCHYQPEDLVKLFLLPNITCLGKRGRKSSDEPGQEAERNTENFASWDDECGQFDDGNAYSDVEDSATLVSQPRQVNKIEVEYDKTSKQVDVQALKEILWSSMQETHETKTFSFKNILASFPTDQKKPAAASLDIISPHLCFICVLHLANEHGLSIHGCADLEDLTIHLPSE
uniref:condensin complex subunit 2-like n=1 Tax=Erigeron canadensis TaxID=72917 RepID=UPI001CB8D3D6|nr:condensin complex subunit 2-like [Erigeron canadensis]